MAPAISRLPMSTQFVGLHCVSYVVDYLLTEWSRVLEEATGLQLIKKFLAFYGNWRFIIACTSARHLSLSWARSIQSIPTHPTSWRSLLILSFHQAWASKVVSFPQVCPPKPCIRLSYPPCTLHDPPISLFLILSPEQYWVRNTDH